MEINRKLHNVNVATNETERLPIMQRKKVFDCSCCPPNITRFIASIGGYIYGEKNGYVYIDYRDKVILQLEMQPYFVEANPLVWDDCGKVALMKGPIVYCVDGQDNADSIWNLYVDTNSSVIDGFDENLKVPILITKGYEKMMDTQLYKRTNNTYNSIDIKFIPYFAFANRGEDDMAVWVKRK